jgi:hypothetical protein
MKLAQRLESKPPEVYPAQAKKRVQMLSYRPDDPSNIIGSYSFRSQRYPGDIDTMNTVGEVNIVGEWHEATSAEAPRLVAQFIERLRSIVANVASSHSSFYLEVKAGYDWEALDRIKPIGDMHNGIFTPSSTLKASVVWAKGAGHITSEAASRILRALEAAPTLGSADYDFITGELRKCYVIRWGADEILAGEKLRGVGQGISLFRAVYGEEGRPPTATKLDVISIVQGAFYEISTFYLLRELLPDGGHHYITALPSLQDITFDVEKTLFSPAWYNPYKAIKRMFIYARAMYQRKIHSRLPRPALARFLENVLTFLEQPVTILYQLKSELETISMLLRNFRSAIDAWGPHGTTYSAIVREIDGMKARVAQTQLSNEDVLRIGHTLDAAIHAENHTATAEILSSLASLFSGITKDAAIRWLAAQGLTPPTRRLDAFLPPAAYIRTLNETTGPADPLLVIQHQRTYDWAARGHPVAAGVRNLEAGGSALGIAQEDDTRARLAEALLSPTE